MNANVTDAFCDNLVVSSDEALALSHACRDMGEVELAAHWARYAEFLTASETYVEPAKRG
jgi:hypothetical protein